VNTHTQCGRTGRYARAYPLLSHFQSRTDEMYELAEAAAPETVARNAWRWPTMTPPTVPPTEPPTFTEPKDHPRSRGIRQRHHTGAIAIGARLSCAAVSQIDGLRAVRVSCIDSAVTVHCLER
jgi:hypothetical protein